MAMSSTSVQLPPVKHQKIDSTPNSPEEGSLQNQERATEPTTVEQQEMKPEVQPGAIISDSQHSWDSICYICMTKDHGNRKLLICEGFSFVDGKK